MATFRSLADLRNWAESAPPGTLIPAAELADVLADVEAAEEAEPSRPEAATPSRPSWRVLLWQVPAETRIGRVELLEATGRPSSWLYRHTGPSAASRIPHRKLDGELVFVVGEVREWLRAEEEIVEAGPTDGRYLRAS